MRHLPDAVPKVENLLAHLERNEMNGPSMQWLGTIRDAYAKRPQHPGGMSGWANDNDSKNIETLTADFDDRNVLFNLGFGGPHNVVWNPMGVQLFTSNDHSTGRKFRGVYTLASSDETYVGYVRDFGQIIVYHTV